MSITIIGNASTQKKELRPLKKIFRLLMKSTLMRDSFKDVLLICRGEVEKNVFERGLFQLELIILNLLMHID
ncbi:MAG: hypothetical protein WCB79_07090, partial [Halobacteriota archaeon]